MAKTIPQSRSLLLLLSRGGLLAGVLGLLVAFNLPGRLWQALDALFRLDFDLNRMEARANPLDSFDSPFVLFPLLALLVWLGGAMIIQVLKPVSPFVNSPTIEKGFPTGLIWLLGGAVIILPLNFFSRAGQLLPDVNGLLPAPNFDEMVYMTASAQLAGGHWPYHDYFLAHPPLSIVVFAVLFKLGGLAAGGLNTLLAGRWLALVLGLLTTLLILWAGSRLWENSQPGYYRATWALPGIGASLVYALDGRVAQVAVLETVSNFFAILGFICLLEALRRPSGRNWFIAAGGLSGFALEAKLPGAAAFFALAAYLLYRRHWRGLWQVCIGFLTANLLVIIPFLFNAGPGQLLRQLIFFQILRPQEVREGKDQVGTLADYPQTGLTVMLLILALLWLSWQIWRGRINHDRWLIPALWCLPLFVVIILGKSFHPWYYVQLALPVALLSGGLFVQPETQSEPGKIRFVRPVLYLLLALLVIPVGLREWQAGQRVTIDSAYTRAGEYLKAQPGNDPILSFDPGFALLAARPLAQLPDGKYLVDSAGYMTYLNLEVDRASLFSLAGQALGLNRERGQVQAIFYRDRAQALVGSAMRPGYWAAVDEKIGIPQLTPRTLDYFGTVAESKNRVVYVDLYRARLGQSMLREWRFDNGLLLTPQGLSTSYQGKANYDQPRPDGTLVLPANQAGSRTLDLRLTWKVEKTPPQQVKVFVHLISETDGRTVAQRDILPLDGKADTSRWQPGDYYQDVHSLPLPSGLATGRYRVELGLYVEGNGQVIPVEGKPALSLGWLEIEPS